MRITVHENDILKAIAKCHPTKSSFAKLVKETGKARNEIEDISSGLKKIGYVNITPANEIYLIEDGRKYLGLDSHKANTNSSVTPKEDIIQVRDSIELSRDLEPVDFIDCKEAKPRRSVLSSIDALATRLNKPVIKIADCDLKGQALTKLADLMADDNLKLRAT